MGCAAEPGAVRRAPPSPAPAQTLPVTEPTPSTPEDYVMDGFSFVDDGVAGLPQPGARAPLEDDLGFLVGQGVGLLVSLTVEPTDPDAVAAAGLDLLHLPVADFQPPTLEQQQALVDAIVARRAAGEAVGVHCTAGLGRTGTMLASWLVGDGWAPEAAIDEIRALRPGSIETTEQEEQVFAFAEALAAEAAR
ncbi:MAG: hypothetical protein R3F59_07080 [Myxococcota bacterium]